jgi:hypothetical protein
MSILYRRRHAWWRLPRPPAHRRRPMSALWTRSRVLLMWIFVIWSWFRSDEHEEPVWCSGRATLDLCSQLTTQFFRSASKKSYKEIIKIYKVCVFDYTTLIWLHKAEILAPPLVGWICLFWFSWCIDLFNWWIVNVFCFRFGACLYGYVENHAMLLIKKCEELYSP